MIPTHKLKRTFPEWAEVVKTINNVQIYNINILQNILSWTADIPHVAAVDYYGTVVTYGELFEKVRESNLILDKVFTQ